MVQRVVRHCILITLTFLFFIPIPLSHAQSISGPVRNQRHFLYEQPETGAEACPYPIPTDIAVLSGFLEGQFRWRDIAANTYVESYRSSYTYDDAAVTVEYETCGDSTWIGILTATDLKPNFAYQMKLSGKPTGIWGVDGDDIANENLGFAGRWWQVAPEPQGNVNDAYYLAHKDDPGYIFEGYLLFDFFITDSLGSAAVTFESSSSYHVLFWEDQRTRQECDSPIQWHTVIGHAGDPAYDTEVGPADVGVYAEIERRCTGSTGLPVGTYNCRLFLTEESFHQSGSLEGNWAAAMYHDDIAFELTGNPPPTFYEVDVVDIGNTESEDGHVMAGWGPIEPATHGGSYGGVDNCRVVYATEANGDGNDWATIDLDFGPSETTPKYITLRHLEGIAQDAFEAYLYPQGDPDYAVMIYSYPGDGRTTELWYNKTITVAASGFYTLKLISTGDSWYGFPTFGQMAFDSIKVEAASSPLWYDYVDVGAGDQNELDHGIPDPGDWGPSEPGAHGGNWGGMGNFEDATCRVIWENGSGDENRIAYFTMDHGDTTCRKDLLMNILEGLTEDAFNVYLDEIDDSNLLYAYNGLQYTLETWVSHTIGYYATGPQAIWLYAIPTQDDPWSGFNTFGKVGVRNLVMSPDRHPENSPIFAMDNPDWRKASGHFIQDGQPTGESYLTTYNQGKGNWTFRADIEPIGALYSAGILFDYIDAYNYALAYVMDAGDDTLLVMERQSAGSWNDLAAVPVSGISFPARMKIYKTGGLVTFEVGDARLTAGSCTDGLLGLWTQDTMADFFDIAFIPARPLFVGDTAYIGREGNHFTRLCQPYYFAGFNNYYQMVFAADEGLKPYVDEVQEEAAAMGLKVMRTWAFNDGAGQWNALQTAPGVYQEYVFQGLDYALDRAHENGLRVILAFVNNWDDYGGMNQYVQWSGTASTHDDFYTDANCRQWYMDHISTVLNRVNTYNGRTYKDDPTIFAWELANEPRCLTDPSGDTLQEWIETMSAYVKSIDPRHLVTTGSEGFYGPTGPNHNPVGWMGSQGVDFIRNHSPETIDFAVYHAWPDWWGTNFTVSMQWAYDHIRDTEDLLGKPVIIEEFGKQRPVETRDQFYQGWYDEVYGGASGGLAAGGSLFWILYHDDYPDYDGFGVYYPADTSTIGIIETEAGKMNVLSGD